MGDQALPAQRTWREQPRAEYDMIARRVGIGAYRFCGLRRSRIRVHANLAEIMSETPLHECTRSHVERSARRRQHMAHKRRGAVSTRSGAIALH
jgi:hypothetical protein